MWFIKNKLKIVIALIVLSASTHTMYSTPSQTGYTFAKTVLKSSPFLVTSALTYIAHTVHERTLQEKTPTRKTVLKLGLSGATIYILNKMITWLDNKPALYKVTKSQLYSYCTYCLLIVIHGELLYMSFKDSFQWHFKIFNQINNYADTLLNPKSQNG